MPFTVRSAVLRRFNPLLLMLPFPPLFNSTSVTETTKTIIRTPVNSSPLPHML